MSLPLTYRMKEFKCIIITGEHGYGMSLYHLKLAEKMYIKKYIEGR